MNIPLKIIQTDSKKPNDTTSNKQTRRLEIQAVMERLWREDPRQFNPERDCIQLQRIQRTSQAILDTIALENRFAADLGCGEGHFSRILRDHGCTVHAIDIASKALECVKANGVQNITPIQDCLPMTKLQDNSYDIVVCTEVIGYLEPVEYRMLMSELARLVKTEGFVVCSTALDIDTEAPLQNFATLADTEFNIEKWVLSHHRLWIKVCRCLEAPSRLVQASHNHEFRQKLLAEKSPLTRWWFRLNTNRPFSWLWKGTNLIAAPMANGIKQSSWIMKRLESVCRFLWNDSGISHALFIGKRRPLAFPVKPGEIPQERKQKREVWE